MINKQIKSFTLAEVLITLVIIGVIAALTIPNLMQKYQEQATVKKVQKFYSTLSNAYSLAMKENGPASEWGLTGENQESAEKIYNLLFKPYFKITKDCGIDNTGNCIANIYYKYLNNEISRFNYSMLTPVVTYKVTLEDGSAVWWKGPAGDLFPPYIYYDVNSHKEPNQFGVDVFSFAVINNSIVPKGIQNGSYSNEAFNSTCNNKSTGTGTGCAAWVIYKGNMDYLHCNLTWDKKGCKDN